MNQEFPKLTPRLKILKLNTEERIRRTKSKYSTGIILQSFQEFVEIPYIMADNSQFSAVGIQRLATGVENQMERDLREKEGLEGERAGRMSREKQATTVDSRVG